MKVNIENPGLREVDKRKEQWFRVKDFLDDIHTFHKIDVLAQTVCNQSGFYIGLLDFRALTEETEIIYPVFSMGELKEFVNKAEELANFNNRYPNKREERMKYYIYNCLFPRTIEMEESRLTPLLPEEKDKWSLFGHKYDGMVRISAIVPRCVVKNNVPFCEYEDLLEEATTNDKT